jgi:hypothetical protein
LLADRKRGAQFAQIVGDDSVRRVSTLVLRAT